ncbi:hypothetical protein [Niallia oryzisoli]|uniref:hypothetical protein n=1 Tax=Niallia oryzisoli TaxID=1737571 RepID=UPI003734FF77
MSLKSVEMQIAIPRTLDAGKIQEQLQQRGQNIVEHANEALQKDVERKTNRVTKNEHLDRSKFLKDREKQSHEQKNREKKTKRTDVQQKKQHPYKGTFIDYSG